MIKTQEQSPNDEIDLLEVLRSLWANKILILTITACFSIIGIAYACLSPQKWSARAVIVAPLPSQLEQLQLKLDSLALMENTSTNDDNRETDNRETDNSHIFTATFSESNLYTDFIQSFNALDNKIEFLEKNGNIRANISVNRGQKGAEFTTLSLSSDKAQEAEKLLNKYLNFIQTKEVAAKNKILVDKITNLTSVHALTYEILEKATLKILKNEIIRTQYALRISRAAGIETPVANLNNQSLFAIDLGAKALSEKLNILKEIKDFEFINPDLSKARLHLDSLKAMPQEKIIFSSYHFLQSPSEPLRRDKPKRALVVMLSTITGLFAGVVCTLLKVSFIFKDGKRY